MTVRYEEVGTDRLVFVAGKLNRVWRITRLNRGWAAPQVTHELREIPSFDSEQAAIMSLPWMDG